MPDIVELRADEAVEFVEMTCRHDGRLLRVYIQFRDLTLHNVLVVDSASGARNRVLEHQLRQQTADGGALSRTLGALLGECEPAEPEGETGEHGQ